MNNNKLIEEIINLENIIGEQYKQYNLNSDENNKLIEQYNNYIINIFDKNYSINYLNHYETFINNININFKGYYNFFINTYIYGKVIYDSLINSIENNNLITFEIDIYFKSENELNNILKQFKNNYQENINGCYILCLNGLLIKLHTITINNLYELFSLNQNIDTLNTIYKLYKSKTKEIINSVDFYNKTKKIYNFCLFKNSVYVHPLSYVIHFKESDKFILNHHTQLALIHEYYNKIQTKNLSNDKLILLCKTNTEYFDIIFKSLVFNNKNSMNYLQIIADNINEEKFINSSQIFFYLVKQQKLDILKIFNNHPMHKLLNKDGFNLLEYAIILYNNLNNSLSNIDILKKQYLDIITFLNNYSYNRSSRWIEYLYNSSIFEYDNKYNSESEIYIKEIKTLGKIQNTILLNMKLTELLIANNDTIEDIYNFIKFNYHFLNKQILIDILVHNGLTITFRRLVDEQIINIDADSLIGLFKLNKEDLNNKKQLKIFRVCCDKILNNILRNSKICNKIIDNKYLELLPLNFVINNNNDTICHLLCNLTYLEEHRQIMMRVMNGKDNIINFNNNDNENCIFNCIKSKNKELFSMLLEFDSNVKQKNIKGNYLIHEIIQNNNYQFLHLLYTLSKDKNIINLQNDNGETPIILAAKNKNVNIINFLNKCGADLIKQDNHGNYIYHYLTLYGLVTDIKIENKRNNYDYFVVEYAMTHMLKIFENI